MMRGGGEGDIDASKIRRIMKYTNNGEEKQVSSANPWWTGSTDTMTPLAYARMWAHEEGWEVFSEGNSWPYLRAMNGGSADLKAARPTEARLDNSRRIMIRRESGGVMEFIPTGDDKGALLTYKFGTDHEEFVWLVPAAK